MDEDEIAVEVSAIMRGPYMELIVRWAVYPNLNVMVQSVPIGNNQVVAELPASPEYGVFYFVKE